MAKFSTHTQSVSTAGLGRAWHLAEQDEYILLLTLKSRLVIADDDLDRPDVSSTGFAHADSPDLLGDIVLSAHNLEGSAAADGADEAAFAAGAFVIAVECVSQLSHGSTPPLCDS